MQPAHGAVLLLPEDHNWPYATHPQVAEPKQDNSGIPQGIFVRRHQVRTDPHVRPIAPHHSVA